MDARRFLRHWAAEAYADDRLRERHSGLGTDRRRTKARQIARLVYQGLAFFESAEGAPTITRPLPLFYGAENLCKAACLFMDSGLDADSIRAHGLGGERQVKRNSVKNLSCLVRSPRKDVWSHVCAGINTDRYRVTRSDKAGGGVTFDQINRYPAPKFRNDAELRFGELVRHLPDIADDLEIARWDVSYMVRSESLGLRIKRIPKEREILEFTLRHGYRPEVVRMIDDSKSNSFRQLEVVRNENDTCSFEGDSTARIPNVRPDIFGDNYMDLSRGRRALGELPTFLASLFILSDVVRYQAENWLRLLHDHPAEEIVVERFLDTCSRKIPNLVLNELHNQIYEFKLAR